MAADVGELVDEGAASDDCEVVDVAFAGELGGVAHDDVVAEEAVVGYVAVCHDEAVVADDGFAFGGCAAVDCDAFADVAVVADYDFGLFAAELEVLRDCSDDCAWEYVAIFADGCAFEDCCVAVDVCAGTDAYVFVDGDEWVDYYVVSQLCVWVNVGKWLFHYFCFR